MQVPATASYTVAFLACFSSRICSFSPWSGFMKAFWENALEVIAIVMVV